MARRKKRRRLAASKIKSLIGQAAIAHQRKRKTMSSLERMLKAGKITTEQFWCGNRFVAGYEAVTSGPGVKAAGFEPKVRGSGQPPEYPLSMQLAAEYADLHRALLIHFGATRGTNILATMSMVFGRGVTLEAVDEQLKQRKGLASAEVCAGLQFLESHFAYELSQERRAAVRVDKLPARFRANV